MRKFLIDNALGIGSRVRLPEAEARHALKVLRLKAGDKVQLMNGRGTVAEARILTASPDSLELEVESSRSMAAAVALEVVQSPLKGPKMDWLVEKLTELGVSAIHPAVTQHTVAHSEKTERWQRIAQAAVKQSGNPLLPEIHPLRPLREVIQAMGPALKILLQPGAEKSLQAVVKDGAGHQRVILAVGPEGGFSPEEEQELIEAGFVPAALSRQILRGETAALAAVAIAAHSIDF